MRIFLIALAAGVIAGYLAGGRLRNLTGLRPSRLWMVWLALGLQLALALVPATLGPVQPRFPIVLSSYGLVAAWLLLNARGFSGSLRAGFALVALGFVLNFAVIAANGGMPVSRDALAAAGLDPQLDVREGFQYKHVPANDSTRLYVLGDVIPVRPIRRVISAGDVALALGIALVVAAAMRRPLPSGGS